jgi:hypothetical protein
MRPVVDLAWMSGGLCVTLLMVSRMEVRLGRMGSPEMVVSQKRRFYNHDQYV